MKLLLPETFFWTMWFCVQYEAMHNSETSEPLTPAHHNPKVKLKKELGLLEGVSIILGIIIGSGQSLLSNTYITMYL